MLCLANPELDPGVQYCCIYKCMLINKSTKLYFRELYKADKQSCFLRSQCTWAVNNIHSISISKVIWILRISSSNESHSYKKKETERSMLWYFQIYLSLPNHSHWQLLMYMGLQIPTSPSANLCRTFSQPTAVDESNIWMQS